MLRLLTAVTVQLAYIGAIDAYQYGSQFYVSYLEVYVQPDGARGGTPFESQPKIAALDEYGDLVDTDLNWNNSVLFAAIKETPDHLAYLEQVGVQDGALPFAVFRNGWANFTGINLDTLGSGFTINFFSYGIAKQVESEPFNNTLGEPFELKLVLPAGTATGGVPFMPQPEVGMVDRGGNLIDYLNTPNVWVELCTDLSLCEANPGGELLKVGITASDNVTMVNGKSVFSGLAIDKAGYPYRLVFHTNYVFNDPNKTSYIISPAFTVGVGRAVEVRIEQQPGGARGGMEFDVQPQISVRDAGGNVVIVDSSTNDKSKIVISLGNNPTGATLSSSTMPTLESGLIDGRLNITGLTIDKAGNEYAVRFTGLMRTLVGELYIVYQDSEKFSTLLGPPNSLEVAREISGTWAGGFPFAVQPIVHLLDPGGNVLTSDSDSLITGVLTKSPTGFNLTGNLVEPLFTGVARFKGLTMVQEGIGYEITFYCDCGDFNVSTSFNVNPSSEFLVHPHDLQPRDRFGYAVSVFTDVIIAGAPYEDRPIMEIQRVTSTASTTTIKQEVQRITTSGMHQVEIQEIMSCGYGGGLLTMDGYFVLVWEFEGIYRRTRPLRYDIHPSVMKSYLEADLRKTGSVTVEKIIHYDCDAINTFKWRVYFDTLEGDISELQVLYLGESTLESPDNTTFFYAANEYSAISSASTALNVSMSVKTLQNSGTLSGYFYLKVGGDGTTHGDGVPSNITGPIPYDASPQVVRNKIEEAMDGLLRDEYYAMAYLNRFSIVTVTRTGPDNQKGYIWDVTFPAYSDIFDWRQMEGLSIHPDDINATNATLYRLNGIGARVKTETVTNGEHPIDGSFRMWFKGEGPSLPIAFDESEETFKTKLASLPTVDAVDVNRMGPNEYGGYTWEVSFDVTRTKNRYGFAIDETQNLPPIVADTHLLRGTDSKIMVEFVYGSDDMDTIWCQHVHSNRTVDDALAYPTDQCKQLDWDQYLYPSDRPVMGKFGHEAGSAYVTIRSDEEQIWKTNVKLRGSDTKSYDHFGHSVSYDNTTTSGDENFPVIVVGAPHASSVGSLEIQTITCNADSGTFALEFRTHSSIYLPFNITRDELEYALENMRSITDVGVTFYNGKGEVEIDGSGQPLTLCKSTSVINSDPDEQVTAAITFHTPNNGDLPLLVPVISPPKQDTTPSLIDSTASVGLNMYKWGSVQITEHIKGTTHSLKEGDSGYSEGAAYVFLMENSTEIWDHENIVWYEDIKLMSSDGQAGDSFGFAVEVYLDTIVVGAPEHDFDVDGNHPMDGAGALYVFKRERDINGKALDWLQVQKLVIPARAEGDSLGYSLALSANTIAAGAPNKDNGKGAVFVWKRQSLEQPFIYDQALSPDELLPGDKFGCSLEIDLNTLVVGAEGSDSIAIVKDSKKEIPVEDLIPKDLSAAHYATKSGKGMSDVGRVYTFLRGSYQNTYVSKQIIYPRTPVEGGRFGYALSIVGDILIITESEEYKATLTPRTSVQTIKTYTNTSGEILGNIFAVTWKTKLIGKTHSVVRRARFSADEFVEKSYTSPGSRGARQKIVTDEFEDRKTLWLEHNVSASEMKFRIENDLETGEVRVTRSDPDANEGFTWAITFLEIEGHVDRLGVISRLTGEGATIDVLEVSTPPPKIRGLGHGYKRTGFHDNFVQQVQIRPEVPQDGDLFGSSICIYGRYVVIGAYNRDQHVIEGLNSGAIYVFDISYFNLKFSQSSYEVSEDDGKLSLAVSRCDPKCDIGRYPKPSYDPDFAMDEIVDIEYQLRDGTAFGRKDCTLQSYNLNDCLWSLADNHEWDQFTAEYLNTTYKTFYNKGLPYDANVRDNPSKYTKYNYRGQSDYAPDSNTLKFLPLSTSKTFEIVITNDEINESPDETLNAVLQSAGMRPVPGGDYWAVVTILDDGDGGVGTQHSYGQFHPINPSNAARFGSTVSIDGDIAVVGAPKEPVTLERVGTDEVVAFAGAVYIYRKVSGVWILEKRLESPAPYPGGGFGTSLQVRDTPPHRLIVGSPGEVQPIAYVYVRQQTNGSVAATESEGEWFLEANFTIGDKVYDARCEPKNAPNSHKCRNGNDHHPLDRSSFFAAENSVSIQDTFAVVGAKGLEAAFIYKRGRLAQWYHYQTVKSSDYNDEVYPKNSEHSKVYVTRALFGGSVAIYNDTLVVGAELQDYDRHITDDIPEVDNDIGLTCSEAGFATYGGSAPIYTWKLNEYNNAYNWEPADLDNDTVTDEIVSTVTCEETDAFTLTITSNGIPTHPVGLFPLSEDTLYSGKADNPNVLQPTVNVFKLPRFPNVTKVNPTSILQEKDSHIALPRGPIGVALNGVPFFNSLDKNGDDTVSMDSIGYDGALTDLCNGGSVSVFHLDPLKRHMNTYAYRSDPICLYSEPDSPYFKRNKSGPVYTTGKLNPFPQFEAALSNTDNPNPGQRSPKLGYALDGFPIYGPFDENGNLPTDLDQCNGRNDTLLGHYVYHITPGKPPYIIGCLKGSVDIPVPQTPNQFPEFMGPKGTSSKRTRDLTFYSRGAVYLFDLREVNENHTVLETGENYSTDIYGIDVAPKPDPTISDDFTVPATHAWLEREKFVAPDRERGDRFGRTVVLENDQLLIGSPLDSAKPRSTWDFETGDLRGWTKTGTAFDSQPTYGDNVWHRNVYGEVFPRDFRDFQFKTHIGSSNREGFVVDIAEYIEGNDKTILYGPRTTHIDHPVPITYEPDFIEDVMLQYSPNSREKAGHRGRFWIGTFENRPAINNGKGNVVPQEPEGNAQEDGPQGTLSSDPFQIDGTKISFLVGGGCDIFKEYVELLIDGVPVKRVTGKCRETMERVTWDVSAYKWQSGVIRIVDASSSNWGHINVDDIRFNWHESYQSRSTTPSSDGTERRNPAGGAMGYTGEPQAGAVYAFRRKAREDDDAPCEIDCDNKGCFFLNNPPRRWACVWEFQQKLQPSDRRADDAFGYAIDLDDDTGTAVISSVRGRGVDVFGFSDLGGKSETGSIYIFKRVAERRSLEGTLLEAPFWMATEHFKYQHADKAESDRDQLGYSVAVSGYTVIAGAPKKAALSKMGVNDFYNPDTIRAFPTGGAAYSFDTAVQNVKFTEKEFVINEAQANKFFTNKGILTVRRTGDTSKTLYVGYQTSDITAVGVSAAKAEYCLDLNYNVRGAARCGDYILKSGILTFEPGVLKREIVIETMNDDCKEPNNELLRVQLTIPGGGPLLGEDYSATLRIDDDDYNGRDCAETRKASFTHPFYPIDEVKDTRGLPAQEEPIPKTERQKWILKEL